MDEKDVRRTPPSKGRSIMPDARNFKTNHLTIMAAERISTASSPEPPKFDVAVSVVVNGVPSPAHAHGGCKGKHCELKAGQNALGAISGLDIIQEKMPTLFASCSESSSSRPSSEEPSPGNPPRDVAMICLKEYELENRFRLAHHEVYVQTMLAEKSGLPCWAPRPQNIVPGDVGTYTVLRGFKKAFNLFESQGTVCALSERYGKHTDCKGLGGDITHLPNWTEGGATVVHGASTRSPGPYSGAGAVLHEFRCRPDSLSGAILATPTPVDMDEADDLVEIEKYLLLHAKEIYRHSNSIQPVGADASLYIVTGCMKASSWAMAAYKDKMDADCDTLRLVSDSPPGDSRPKYRWESGGLARTRWGSTAGGVKDQPLFLLGFKLGFSSAFRSRIQGGDDGGNDPEGGNDPRSQGPTDSGPNYNGYNNHPSNRGSRPNGGSGGSSNGAGDQGQHRQGQQTYALRHSFETNAADAMVVTRVGDTHPQPHHPCDVMNARILEMTSYDVSVCHDNTWCQLLENFGRPTSNSPATQIHDSGFQTFYGENGIAYIPVALWPGSLRIRRPSPLMPTSASHSTVPAVRWQLQACSPPLDQQPSSPLPRHQRPLAGERPAVPHAAPPPPFQQRPAQIPGKQQQEGAARCPSPQPSATLGCHAIRPVQPPSAATAVENECSTRPPKAPPVANAANDPAVREIRTIASGSGRSMTIGPVVSQMAAGSAAAQRVRSADAGTAPSRVGSRGSSIVDESKGTLPERETDAHIKDKVERKSVQLLEDIAQDLSMSFEARSTLPDKPENKDTQSWAKVEQWFATVCTEAQQATQAAAPAYAPGTKRRFGANVVRKGRPGFSGTASRGGVAWLGRISSHENVAGVIDKDGGESAMRAAATVWEHEQQLKKEEEVEMLMEAAEREAATREKERQVMSKTSRRTFTFGPSWGHSGGSDANNRTEIPSHAPWSDEADDVKGKGRETEESLAAQELSEAESVVQRLRESSASVLVSEKQVKKEQARKEADAVARAKAQESLADPLLPQGMKRMILLTSESDYPDTDDDAPGTREDVDEGGAVESPASRQQPPSARQSSHQESCHAQQSTQWHQLQQQQPPPHPLAVQRTHSTVSDAGRTTRRELQHIQQRREAQLRVQRAAAQLQREEEGQREMFAKKPTRSFQSLTELQRTMSAGLLTQMMTPISPAEHPYTRRNTSGEVQRMGMSPMMSMASPVQARPSRTQKQAQAQQPQELQQSMDEQPAPKAQSVAAPPVKQRTPKRPRQKQQQNVARRPPLRWTVTLDSCMMPHPPSPPVGMTTDTESTGTIVPPSPVCLERRAPSITDVAIGYALRGMRSLGFGSGNSTATGSSASTKHVAEVSDVAPSSSDTRGPGSSTGYWHKGSLLGKDMAIDGEDKVGESSGQLPKSFAQDHLRQFAARRGIVAASPAVPTQPENQDTPAWARRQLKATSPAEVQQRARTAAPARGPRPLPTTLPPPALSLAPASAPRPIPMMQPDKSPASALPSTPRTTRVQMLRNEMSESLRRQLLWERQQAGVPMRRTTSGGRLDHQSHNALNLTTPSDITQLHAKATVNSQQPNVHEVQAGPSNALRGSGNRERRASSRPSEGNDDARRQALARNRSWTNNYHTSGW